MKLEQSFEVEAPIEQVWTALIDLEKVAPCLPGAEITGHDEDGTYHGTFSGQARPGERELPRHDQDRVRRRRHPHRDAERRGAATSAGKVARRRRSSTRCNASDGGGTRVDAATDFTITGRLASFGRGGMIKDISNRLMRDFATCLQQRLAAEPSGEMTADEAAASAGIEAEEQAPAEVSGKAPGEVGGASEPPPAPATPPPAATVPAPAPPVKGFSLLLSVLWERIRGLFRRGR